MSVPGKGGIIIRGARVLTLLPDRGQGAWAPVSAARGTAMNNLGVLESADVVMENGVIAGVFPGGAGAPGTNQFTEIEAKGRVLMPGFVDAHTHALWAGDRLDEWEQRRAGASYLDILKSGGGIMSTVRAVRGASETELDDNLCQRLGVMLREGTTTVEVKSGYGLTTQDELKMLRVIRRVGEQARGQGQSVLATALLGHAVDAAQPGFVESTIHQTLDAVHAEFPGVTLDAFCEQGAWSLEQCAHLFERGRALGHPFRVHADQFNDLGMTPWAVGHGAVSVDHLEATSQGSLRRLAESETFGVMLPCCGFHTDGRYADGRGFVDAPGGGKLVIATNCNPGSAPTSSMPLAIALAVRHLGLSVAEAVMACTRNAAVMLGLTDRGVIAPGARADAILLRHTDERLLAYEVGGNPVEVVIAGGKYNELL